MRNAQLRNWFMAYVLSGVGVESARVVYGPATGVSPSVVKAAIA